MNSKVEVIQGSVLFAFLIPKNPIMLHSLYWLIQIMGYIHLLNRCIKLPVINIAAASMYQNESSTYLFP